MAETVTKYHASRSVRQESLSQDRVGLGERCLAEEVALEIAINGQPYGLLMQTPGRERELVVGYLFTEGLIEGSSEVEFLSIGPGAGLLGLEGLRAEARLPRLEGGKALPERLSLSLSSCGLCGKESLDQVGRGVARVRSRRRFSWQVLPRLVEDLHLRQPLYEETRGVHAAAIYEADGAHVCCFEDVGRHNALDKAIGHCLLEGIGLEDKAVVLSGRASLEMILKAARGGIPLVLCFSNPTVLAVEAAKSLNLTLVARESGETLAAYTHTRRLEGP
jgi:FdhD protein